MKTKIMIAVMLMTAGIAMAQKKTVEKRTWQGTGSSETYVMRNGQLVPASQAAEEDKARKKQQKEQEEAEKAEQAARAAQEAQQKAVSQQTVADIRPGSYRMAKDYYERAGKAHLSFISGGYTLDLADNFQGDGAPFKHVIDLSVLDWRVRWFGMSLLNFEMELGNAYPDKFDHRAIYKPTVNFYIPVCKALAVKLYGGAEADMSYIYKANPNYDYNYDRDFFFNVDAGVGFQVVPHGWVPIEINCEYRYPIESLTKAQDRLTQGFYLTGRFYIGMPF